MRIRFHAINEERSRLAREMHDTVIQGCVGVSSLLEAALGVDASEEPLRQQLLSYATDQVRATIETAREAVWALRHGSPLATDAGDLCKDLSLQFQSESGTPVACSVEGIAFKLGESATHELMMTVKEALTNAIAHGEPKNISIQVCFTPQFLKVDIEDDGRGFDTNVILSQNGHYGILGMQERILLTGGNLSIESEHARGTVVHITLPRKQKVLERMVTSNASQSLHED
jgi:signal transduction histidine kinase